MDEFKKCLHGHPYDSKLEECPFCNGVNIDDELGKLPEKNVDKDALKYMADCYLMVND